MTTVCTLGYHDRSGTRFWVLTQGLRSHGIAVADCHTGRSGFFPKMMDLWKQARGTPCDAILVTFPGQYLMPLAWLLAKWKRVPVVLDAFISLHDTMVIDRQKVRDGSVRSVWLKLVDRMSCRLADAVLLDTPEHAAFFTASFGVPEKKILVIPVGYRTDILHVTPVPARAPGDPLKVLFYGTFIPLQGIDTILRAMEILQKEHLPITLDIVGDGQTGPAMRALAQSLGLTNVTFHAPRPLPVIAAMQEQVHCGLGIFGATPKAMRVIPHKAYDVLACGRALITGDTPASRRALIHGTNALLTPMANHEALAKALRTLLQDPALCESLGQEGGALIQSQYQPAAVTEPLAAWLRSRTA